VNYYNEIDPQCAQWLRNLISAGLIPHGDVDERSIEDVVPNELRGYTQHHFFAGIAGWSLALDLAGWPRDVPVITGSCPCQSFSIAGKGAGFADKRHLWPAWFHIIREMRPNVVFGEQVSAAIRFGWLDLVSSDLEGAGYAVGSAVLGAHSVGAPHIRQRLYWVAESDSARRQGRRGARPTGLAISKRSGVMGDASGTRLAQQLGERGASPGPAGRDSRETAERAGSPVGALVQPDSSGPFTRHSATESAGHGRTVEPAGFWADAEWIECRDGKSRAVEPRTAPLASGLPRSMGNLGAKLRELAGVARLDAKSLKGAKDFRVTQLRGYGNAIVPPQAAEFIKAYMSAEQRKAVAA